MSRDIKFRAWVTAPYRTEPLMFVQGEPGLETIDSFFFHLPRSEQEGSYELMQFTGLKDKNGVEIYEDDIVKVEVEQIITDTEIVASVEIRPEGVMFDYGSGAVTFDACDCDTCEVIGNIHENADLLGTNEHPGGVEDAGHAIA